MRARALSTASKAATGVAFCSESSACASAPSKSTPVELRTGNALPDVDTAVVQTAAAATKQAAMPSSAVETAMQSLSHVYRKDKLTMALKNALTSPLARTVVVCTVSPSSSDTEHSLSTLRHACIMAGQSITAGGGADEQENAVSETRFLTGGRVTTSVIGTVKPQTRKTSAAAGKSTSSLGRGKEARASKVAGASSSIGDEEVEEEKREVDEEVLRLEQALADPAVSAATKYGLKKRLAMRRAQLKKEEKQKESEGASFASRV